MPVSRTHIPLILSTVSSFSLPYTFFFLYSTRDKQYPNFFFFFKLLMVYFSKQSDTTRYIILPSENTGKMVEEGFLKYKLSSISHNFMLL